MTTTLRALIVEDSAYDAGNLVEELRKGGYDVRFQRVENAREMNAALNQAEWDVVIANYRLPYFSGPAALGLLHLRDADTPFIMTSGIDDENLAVAALKVGAHDFVDKKNLERLAPAVARALREVDERRVRQRAEEALRHSEQRYRQLFENANDVVLTIDLKGNLTSLNPAAEQISGYSRAELEGTNIANVLTPDSLQKALQMIQQKLIDNRPTTYELEMVARDGRRVPVEVSSRLIEHEGTPVGVQAIARDITERKRTERELLARERKQAAVADLGYRALATSDLSSLFEDGVSCVSETLGVEFCTVTELLPHGKALLARAGVGWKSGLIGGATVGAGPESQAGYTLMSSEPVVVEDLSKENRFAIPAVLTEHLIKSGMSVIIHGQRRTFGVLAAFTAERRSFSQDDVHFLQAVANVLATAIERKRLEEERAKHSKELATRVIQAQEEERRRIARELHDETAQSLSMLLTNLDLMSPHIPEQAGTLKAHFDRVEALARRTLDETRALSHDLRPTILDDAGLVAALEWVAAEYEHSFEGKAQVHAEVRPDSAISPEVEVALFRIAQEAVMNSGKHARASEVRISLCFPDTQARLVVEDNGQGFDPETVPAPTREGRLGLYGMRERAELLGGKLTIAAKGNKGTQIMVELPLQGATQEHADAAGE